MHYSRAPIAEAIIDFRVVLPEEFSLEHLENIRAKIAQSFPTVQPFYKGIGSLTYEPGSRFQVDTSEQQIGLRFHSGDTRQIFQATLEGFTFNRLAPYTSWEEFSEDAKRLWEIYKEICQPIQITRAAIRYVNQINIPTKDLIDLIEYLSTLPEVSSDFQQSVLQGFFMQLQIPQRDLDCMLIVNEAIAPPTNPEVVTIILDFDLFRESTWERDEDLWPFLEKLRIRKNEVFEASITNRTRELIS